MAPEANDAAMEPIDYGSPDGVAAATAVNNDNDNNNNMEGFTMRWSRIRKTVEIREAQRGLIRSSISAPPPSSEQQVEQQQRRRSSTGVIQKVILNDVSASATPGTVTALIGPSGSGKTSLLNVLSGRSSYDSGVITINGKAMTGQSMKKLMSKIAYVKQNDIFFGHLTVRDQLTYTALLRLSSDITKQEKHREVDRIIKLLRLTKVADSPIMLLSGGEKKRVNIGTELLTDPAIIMLDEPTSGLDSTSAVSLVALLHDLAAKDGGNKTIVTSIHQPSSAVFRSFDKLLLLADGNVVYFGTPVNSLSYLRRHDLACPDGYNAADHWMDLLVHDSTMEDDEQEEPQKQEEEEGQDEQRQDEEQGLGLRRRSSVASAAARAKGSSSPRMQLICDWDGEAVAEQNDLCEKEESDSGKEGDALLDKRRKYNTSWWVQFTVLTHRSLKNSRAAIFTPLNLIKSAALGIVVGLLWWQLGTSEAFVADRSSYYFFTMTYWVFDSMFNALLSFPIERDVILKERASASYYLSAYFMAKTASETPTRLALPFIYMCISFWMAAMSQSFVVFLGSTACTLMSVLAGESFGLLIGTSIYDMERAITVMTVISLALMLLGGFFVENVPDFVSWAKYLSPFKYAYDGSLQIVFDSPVQCDGSGALGELCGGESTGSVPPEDVEAFLGVQGSVGFNVGLLAVLIVVPRFFAYRFLRAKKGGDRS